MQTINDIIQEGFSLHQNGLLDEAENIYNEGLTIGSDNAELCNLMGVLQLQKNNVEDAIRYTEKAVMLNPCAYFYETLFQAYIRAGKYQNIVDLSGKILANFPKSFSLLFNLAMAYRNLKNHKEAIKFYEKALKIDPSSYEAWFNLAHIYSIEGQCQNAVSALKICSKIKPHDKETEYFLSIALMRVKDYKNGLELFENRLCREAALGLVKKTYPHMATDNNLWHGEKIKDKTLYVYYEAGFGDVIMFSRYLPLIKKRCKKLVFAPQKPLVSLFAENGLGIDEIIDGYIPESEMNFDMHLPLLSAPYVLGLKGDKVFQSASGYLHSNPELTEEFRQKYFDNNKIKIGIKWQGNTYYDKDRVIPTEAFEPLIDIDNTQFYSFQTYEGSEETKKLTDKYNIIDMAPTFTDFNHTAAALENLDLVICNDTSLAHLAGAMNKPCFVLLPYEVNWRWHEDLRSCDWYDSIKLFRQKTSGDWKSIFDYLYTYINEVLDNYNKSLQK